MVRGSSTLENDRDNSVMRTPEDAADEVNAARACSGNRDRYKMYSMRSRVSLKPCVHREPRQKHVADLAIR